MPDFAHPLQSPPCRSCGPRGWEGRGLSCRRLCSCSEGGILCCGRLCRRNNPGTRALGVGVVCSCRPCPERAVWGALAQGTIWHNQDLLEQLCSLPVLKLASPSPSLPPHASPSTSVSASGREKAALAGAAGDAWAQPAKPREGPFTAPCRAQPLQLQMHGSRCGILG